MKSERSTLLITLTRFRRLLVKTIQRPDFTPSQRKVLQVLLLKTVSFGRSKDRVSVSQIVQLSSLKKSHVCKAIQSLKDRGFIGSRGGGAGIGNAAVRWINTSILLQDRVTKSGTNSVTQSVTQKVKKLAAKLPPRPTVPAGAEVQESPASVLATLREKQSALSNGSNKTN